MSKMRIISLGWGVQSFTLAAMVALGELEPIDAAIHSDTGYESQLTYEFAARWTPWMEEHGVRVVTVKGTSGTLEEVSDVTKTTNKGFLKIPAFTEIDGIRTILPRECTTEWKIAPVRRWLQANRNKQTVEQWIGISLDEMERMRSSDVKYITNCYPLFEKRITRTACQLWLERNGIEVPPKSACVFCPYHKKSDWIRTKSVTDDWRRAVAMDEHIRDMIDGRKNYLSYYLKPLMELDLSTQEENGQMNFFDCSGTCWL